MTKVVCVVTSTRADYGIMRPLIQRLHDAGDIELRLVATGMHLCPEFGCTVSEIEADGFPVHRRLEIQMSGDAPAIMSKSMGMALIAFADYFREHTPDLLVVLGDRYEIAAVCCAAVNQRVPIAHLHGGEITEGAVDNSFRHAITKMACLHFTSAEPYRRRVIQMGEPPDTVFNFGAMGVENTLNMNKLTVDELAADLGFPLRKKGYAIVTFHPVTLEDGTGDGQVHELMAALDSFPEMRFIITKSNSDAGGRSINSRWQRYAGERQNCLFVDSLGAKRYISALASACMMIGNSSSGLTEGPASRVPTVNIGDRQKGRIRTAGIVDCMPQKDDIVRAIKKAGSDEFQKIAEQVVNPYGNGDTSEKILSTIKYFLLQEKLAIMKTFVDLDGSR